MLSLARGSFWYKCPFVPLIVRNFSPHPPSPSSHTHFTPIYTYSYDTFISRTGILWAKEPPSTLPTRIDSCPLFWFCGRDGSFEYHTPIVTVEPIQFEVWPFHWRSKIFRVEILEKNPSPWDDSNTFWRRPRAKNPTFILVREKKSALLACLWLSSISKTHVAIVKGFGDGSPVSGDWAFGRHQFSRSACNRAFGALEKWRTAINHGTTTGQGGWKQCINMVS